MAGQVASRTPGMRQQDTCHVFCSDLTKVRSVRDGMKSDEVFVRLAETFKAFGDPTRARIVYALSKDELCVCDLAGVLGMSVSAVSHQLRVLRGLRMVKFRRAGKIAFYSLDDRHVGELLAAGLEHVEE